MPDREKTIAELANIANCLYPYIGSKQILACRDAIELLKEQEDDTDWKAVAMILADTLSEIKTDVCCDSRCGQGFHCIGHSELGFVPTRCWIEWAKGEKLWRPEVN